MTTKGAPKVMRSNKGFQLRLDLYDACVLLKLAEQAAPSECCGLIFQHFKTWAEIVALKNVADDPTHQFHIDRQDYLQACMRYDRKPMAVFHSHPHSQPTPSATDLQLMDALEACNTGMEMVIVGLTPPTVNRYRKIENVYRCLETIVVPTDALADQLYAVTRSHAIHYTESQ